MGFRSQVRGWLMAAALGVASPAWAAPVTGVVHGDRPGAVMAPELQGQFAEHLGAGIYGGVWVGEDSAIPNIRGYRKDVVEALRAIRVPVVRWPGGCFADEYHWRDGIGPRGKRPVRLNMSWGGVEEPNSFGTHEFMDFAELIGAKTYLSANVGTGTPGEMNQWVEYLTSDKPSSLAAERRTNGRERGWKVDYLGIGNETWGCGGSMRAEYYADLYRHYATFVKPPGDKPIVKVAVGPAGGDLAWTETMMTRAGDQIDALSLHNYTIPTGDWGAKGPSTGFGEAGWAGALKGALQMDEFVTGHSAVMDRFDPKKRVGLYVDEWGVWLESEPGTNGAFLYQQNSLRDALVAAIHLDIFQNHADRVRMANIAQMVNVLQAMILTDGERMVTTPTYHVFDMYQVFQGATVLPVEIAAPTLRMGGVELPGVHASAGRGADGRTHVALVNLDPARPVTLELKLPGVEARQVAGRLLTAPAIDTVNSFADPKAVVPVAFKGAKLNGGTLAVDLPARSVVVLTLD